MTTPQKTFLFRTVSVVAFVLLLSACGATASDGAEVAAAPAPTDAPVEAPDEELETEQSEVIKEEVSVAATPIPEVDEVEDAAVEVAEDVPAEDVAAQEDAEDVEEIENSDDVVEAAEPSAQTAVVDPVFDSVISDLEAGTAVPLRIPAVLIHSEVELYPSVGTLSDDEYWVSLDLTPNCGGGGSCSVGTITGSKAVAGQRLSGGVPVPLPNGLQGQFFEATCGASCGDAILFWTEGDYQYHVGHKSGQAAQLIEWAWSAIAPEQTPPRPPQTCDSTNRIDIDSERQLSINVADQLTGLYWMVLCGPNDVRSAIINGSATPRLLEASEAPLVALAAFDDSVIVFSGTMPILDQFGDGMPIRFTDLRCGSDGSAIDLLADAATGQVFDRFGREIVHEGAIEADALEAC